MKFRSWKASILAGVTAVLVAAAAYAICGPGVHWVDGCNAGNDALSGTTALVGIDLTLDGIVDQNLVLVGPTNISRTGPLDDSTNYPGTRPVDGHRDVIDTEIISLNLIGGGATLKAGLGQGQGGVLPRSPGAIAEQSSNNSLAESFFDVFFEVDLGGGTFVYNQTALRLTQVIDRVPPNGEYRHVITSPIPLFTAPSGGSHVANLVTASHIVRNPKTPTTNAWGFLALAAALLTLGTLIVVRRRNAA